MHAQRHASFSALSLALFSFLIFLMTSSVVGQEEKAANKTPVDSFKGIRVPGEVFVGLHNDVTVEQFTQVLALLNPDAKIKRVLSDQRLLVVEVDDSLVLELSDRLRSHPYTTNANPNWKATISKTFNDPDLASKDRSWGLTAIGVQKAWNVTTGGAKVGVVDSGVWMEHEDLKANLISPYSFATDSEKFQTGEIDTQSGGKDRIVGHGTHVAGTIGAIADNSIGTAGVAPDSKIIPIQVLFYNPAEQNIGGSSEYINAGIRRAINEGAQVVNLSIENPLPDDIADAWRNANAIGDLATMSEIETKVNEALKPQLADYNTAFKLARDKNVLLVKAAGNQSYLADFEPLCISGETINVGAVDATLNPDGTPQTIWRTDFSNFGRQVHVSAPGIRIWSTFPENNGYKNMPGTSMAAPHVTGLLALMKTIDKDLTREEAVDILTRTGRRLDSFQRLGPMINAPAAIAELQARRARNQPRPPKPPTLVPDPPTPPTKPELPPTWEDIVNGFAPWNNADVQRLIDLWLSIATPKTYPALNPDYGPWWYDEFGRIRCRWITAKIPPVWGSYKYKYLWENSKKYDSENYLTLYEFIINRLKSGKFDPTPAPLKPPADRPPEIGSQPSDEIPADRQWLGKWKGKNKEGAELEIVFRGDATVTISDGPGAGYYEVDIVPVGEQFTGELHRSLIGISLSQIGFRFQLEGDDQMQFRSEFDKTIPQAIDDDDAHVYLLTRVTNPGIEPDYPREEPPFCPRQNRRFSGKLSNASSNEHRHRASFSRPVKN